MKRKLGEKTKKLPKKDLLFIATTRSNLVVDKEFKKQKVLELRTLLGDITTSEVKALNEWKNARKDFEKHCKNDLKKTLIINNLGKGSAMSKSEMIDFIISKKLIVSTGINLDPDQSAIVKKFTTTSKKIDNNNGKEREIHLISAGPGSGKSRSLAALAAKMAENKQRILILMFNVAAEASMISRIEASDGKLTKLSKDFDPWASEIPAGSIVCMTFNKFAVRVISSNNGGKKGYYNKFQTSHTFASDGKNPENLNNQIPEATKIISKRPLINRFDKYFVDEAQDICGKIEEFNYHLRNIAPVVIFTGDPKQECYQGARFFSDLWASFPMNSKMILHYNHRSHPEIVKMLNLFSDAAFITLHHNQETLDDKLKITHDSKETKPPVSILSCSRDDMASAIAHELIKHKPNDVYIITPITVTTWNLNTLFMDVRNHLVEMNCLYPFKVLDEDSKYNPTDQVYFCGTARKLKGTERKNVIAIGLELPYDKYGVGITELLKLEYVTLSRAIDNLCIVIPEGSSIDPVTPLGKVIKSIDSNFKFKKPEGVVKRVLQTVKVRDDLSKSSNIAIQFTDRATLEGKYTPTPVLSKDAQEIMRVKCNEDFVGLYIEALLALKMGADTSKWDKILTSPGTNIKVLTKAETRVAVDGHRFYEELPDKTYRLLLRYDESLLNINNIIPQEIRTCKDYAYVLTVLNYTSQIGKWWVASKDVLHAAQSIRAQLDNLVDLLVIHLGTKSLPPPIWGEPISKEVHCCRSKKITAHIDGIADLLFEKKMVIEIKFAAHSEAHLRQTAIYSSLFGVSGVLVNVLEGKTYNVEPANDDAVDRHARLLLAIKNGRSNTMGMRIKVDDVKLPGAVLVPLDVESDGFPPNAPLLEVSGAAWYFGTEDIEGTFSSIVKGSIALLPGTVVPKMSIASSLCGLLPPSDKEEYKVGIQNLRQEANTWFHELRGRKIGLVWGGCDDFGAAGISLVANDTTAEIPIINVHELYKQWLKHNGCDRKKGTKLQDAINNLFTSDLKLEWHRSWDDALGTLLVFNSIVDFGGAL